MLENSLTSRRVFSPLHLLITLKADRKTYILYLYIKHSHNFKTTSICIFLTRAFTVLIETIPHCFQNMNFCLFVVKKNKIISQIKNADELGSQGTINGCNRLTALLPLETTNSLYTKISQGDFRSAKEAQRRTRKSNKELRRRKTFIVKMKMNVPFRTKKFTELTIPLVFSSVTHTSYSLLST